MKRAFDYVIVGGGSAGCVIANRLSKLTNKSICLLEAGPPDNSMLIHTPALLGLLVGQNKQLNWCYDTIPQNHLNNRKLFWPRGKTLGGSSSINAMIYIRGQKEDYDSWKIPGWSYNEFLPYFISTEKQLNMESVSKEYHGTNGELAVSNQYYTHPFSHLFLDAAKQLGETINNDFNGETQEGYGLYQTTIEDGKRCSSSKAFLTPEIRNKDNLSILTNTQATRLSLQPSNKEIQGLYVVDNRKVNEKSSQDEIKEHEEFIEAGEVILCGGAINTPQLLLLSGIGPKNEIESKGISLHHELPGVGQNLQDHLDVILSCKEKGIESYGVSLSIKNIWNNMSNAWEYNKSNKGPLSSNAAEAGGFVKSSDNIERPDIQFHFVPGLLVDHCRTMVYDHGYSLHTCNLRPKSMGYIGLESANPLAKPLIDPKYLEDPEDLEVMLNGVKKARQLIRSSVFDIHFDSELHPKSSIQSDNELKEWIKQQAETVYHPIGTCKMGNNDDDLTVVDSNLSVLGIKGLKIADASIMPKLISGNTNAPCIAIGEKCAKLIIEQQKE